MPLERTQGASGRVICRIRVAYSETDQMGVVHHASYFCYFEKARMEHFRSHGCSYVNIEKSGVFLMVIEADCKFRSPARFDEQIDVTAWVARLTSHRIVHEYEVRGEDGRVIAFGRTVIASVDYSGVPLPLPEHLRLALAI